MSAPTTLFEKLWERHLVRPQTDATPAVLYIDLHLVHEVTSAQAFTELRNARPEGARAAAHDRDDGSLHADDAGRLQGDAGARPERAVAQGAARSAREELRGVRHPAARAGRQAAGDRARDRTRARAHAARHDRGVRRQPHEHARRVRRAGVRDRHVAGGARARVAVSAADASEDARGARRWRRCARACRRRT